MKYLVVILAAMCYFVSRAEIIKDKEPGIIEVQYAKTSVSDTLKGRSHTDPMTLRVGKSSAMFYPTKKMWSDSLSRYNFELHEKLYREANPIGKPAVQPLGGLEREFLFRNVTDGETMVYKSIGGVDYSYSEPTEAPDWEIKQVTKEILGYQCQLATCDFRGRKWNVWFTPEIPVKEGPWKLFGLPGLVLEASDSKHHYSYMATGISTQNIGPVGIRLYIRETPYKLKSRQKFLQKIYDQTIKGKFVASMSRLYGNGSQSIPEHAQYDSQERDYPHE